MKLVAFFICEYVNRLKDNRFNALGGGFSTIHNVPEPKEYPLDFEFGIVFWTLSEPDEIRDHKLSIKLMKNKKVIGKTVDGLLRVNETLICGVSQNVSYKIPEPGLYMLTAFLGDEPFCDYPLTIPSSS